MNTLMVRKSISILFFPRALLHYLLFCLADAKARKYIRSDILKWSTVYSCNNIFNDTIILQLNWFMWRFPEFRNLFYYRLKKQNSQMRYIAYGLTPIMSIFYKPLDSLFIYCDSIGESFFIQHGNGSGLTGIIGDNCWVNHNVTIGHNGYGNTPTIGNNVAIRTGAVVTGKITIGDNVTIGANTVVLKDIPANCKVLGQSARIIETHVNRKTSLS